MTREEELTYLFGILSEASKWTASSDDPRDLVRMEVEERIANLIKGVTPEADENGLIQSTIHPDIPVVEPLTADDFKALEAQKLEDYIEKKRAQNRKAKEKWKNGRVRVTIDGKPVWKLESDCQKEIIPGFKKKWHWVWNGKDL